MNNLRSPAAIVGSLTTRCRIFVWTLITMFAVIFLSTSCSARPLHAQALVTDGDQVWVNFTRSNGQTAATFFVWPRQNQVGFTEILVQFPYAKDVNYRLDAFTLEVTAERSIQPYITMEATPYGWETMTFSRIDEGVRLHVPNTGKSGDGTIDISLLVPDQLMAERAMVLRATLQTRGGDASGEIRLAKRD